MVDRGGDVHILGRRGKAGPVVRGTSKDLENILKSAAVSTSLGRLYHRTPTPVRCMARVGGRAAEYQRASCLSFTSSLNDM